jgi:hypothetical protein
MKTMSALQCLLAAMMWKPPFGEICMLSTGASDSSSIPSKISAVLTIYATNTESL